MTDPRLGHAYAAEEKTQAIIAAYKARCEALVKERGTLRDPDFTDEITDESLAYVQANGFPQINAFSLTDINEAQGTAPENSPIHNFLEADDITYLPLTGNQVYAVKNRFDDSVAHTERLDYMGSFASSSNVVAVIDGTGRQFVAHSTKENRDFLAQHGYKDVGRNFNVPLSNAETPIGLKGKGTSYAVHMAVTSMLGMTTHTEDVFNSITRESTAPKPKERKFEGA